MMFHSSERVYTCSICGKQCRDKFSLHEHVRVHTGDRPYKCKYCSKAFKTSGVLHRHERTHASEFESMRLYNEMRSYSCTRCCEEFSTAVARNEHMKEIHHLTGLYLCLKCDIELVSVEELLRHHACEHSNDIEESGTLGVSVNHQMPEYGEWPSEFTSKDSGCVVKLISIQNGDKVVIENSESMLGAAKMSDVDSAKKYVCKICQKGFMRTSSFTRHLMKHTELKTDPGRVKVKKVKVRSKKSSAGEEMTDEVGNEFDEQGDAFISQLELVKDENVIDDKTELQVLIQEIVLQNSGIGEELMNETQSELLGEKLKEENTLSDTEIGGNTRDERNDVKSDDEDVELEFTCITADRPAAEVALVGIDGELEDNSMICNLENTEEELCVAEEVSTAQEVYENELLAASSQNIDNLDSEEGLTCDVCGKQFFDSFRFKTHIKTHQGNKPYGCSVCEKRFKSKNMCDVHEMTHSVVKSFPCPDCNKVFNNPYLLYSHINSMHKQFKEVRQYKCSVCSQSFAFMYRLRRHMLHHTGEKPYICKECGKGFTTNAYMKSHMARHSSVWTYLCSVCGKCFADRLAWRTHRRCHIKKEHVCWVCGLKLSSASNLKRHVQCHTDGGERPFKCNLCDRQFRTKEGFRYHIGTHAAEKPYLCMECPRAFADAFSLKTHFKFHSRQGAFVCNICGKKYKTYSYMKIHSRGHAIQEHSCMICGETFGYARHLRTHLAKHKPPYKCEKCGVTCTRSNGLRKHQKRFQH